jgi:hypothetical protein
MVMVNGVAAGQCMLSVHALITRARLGSHRRWPCPCSRPTGPRQRGTLRGYGVPCRMRVLRRVLGSRACKPANSFCPYQVCPYVLCSPVHLGESLQQMTATRSVFWPTCGCAAAACPSMALPGVGRTICGHPCISIPSSHHIMPTTTRASTLLLFHSCQPCRPL